MTNAKKESPAMGDRIILEEPYQDKEDADVRGLPNKGDKRSEEFFRDPSKIAQELAQSRARERRWRLITPADIPGDRLSMDAEADAMKRAAKAKEVEMWHRP